MECSETSETLKDESTARDVHCPFRGFVTGAPHLGPLESRKLSGTCTDIARKG